MQFLLRLILVVCLFLGSLLAFYSYDGEYDEEFASRTQSSLKKKSKLIEGRELEDSFILNQTDKTKDEPSALFNDPAIAQAWGLKKTSAAKAWAVTRGSRKVVVAIIDTGADIKHEDLHVN